ncbi:MAG TPA: hypothetical protein PKJ26_04115 [Candidatus Woesebacteria bacterium]|nr:hypothetical protein [Candidatus Woesebacteria bacterium]HNS65654.1 hypothetical protein [Candidatus Woesebacteria bacterium]
MVGSKERLGVEPQMNPHFFLAQLGFSNLDELFFAYQQTPFVAPLLKLPYGTFDEITVISLDQFNEVISALDLRWSVPLFADRVSGHDLISYWLNYNFRSEITISADRATVEKVRTNLIALNSEEKKNER